MEPSPAQDSLNDDLVLELNADAFDPVLEVFKREIDFSLVERNLKLTTDQRAQQLVNTTRFITKFRPLAAHHQSRGKGDFKDPFGGRS